MTEYEALEEGTIITSSGDHPGPRDMEIRIHKGETFQLTDEYVPRNNLELQESKGSAE